MIAVASDHAGLALKKELVQYLKEVKIPFQDFGTDTETRCDYTKYAALAARAVAQGMCSCGILCCGTGIGMSIAANKVKGIRCGVCSESYSAVMSKRHNNTNMLALGSRVVGAGLAVQIVKEWLEAEYEGGRHQKRLNDITRLEEECSFS